MKVGVCTALALIVVFVVFVVLVGVCDVLPDVGVLVFLLFDHQ